MMLSQSREEDPRTTDNEPQDIRSVGRLCAVALVARSRRSRLRDQFRQGSTRE